MRRILFTMIASAALLVTAPAPAFARQRHLSPHRKHATVHRKHRSASHRTRVKKWGSDATHSSAAEQADAGTVKSFSGGVLVITLGDGSTVSGHVTSATELECEAAEPENTEGVEQSSDHGDHGDNGGSGDDGKQGDDNGADENNQGEEANDQAENEQACDTSALAPGTAVKEAELRISSSGASWKKVELD